MNLKTREKLYWEGIPKTISDIADLQKRIRDFKCEDALEIIKQYYDNAYPRFKDKSQGKTYPRFKPKLSELPNDVDIGIFSTAACFETIALYKNNTNDDDEEKDLTFKKEVNDWISKVRKNATLLFEFVIRGLDNQHLPREANKVFGPGFLACITSLIPFGNYIKQDKGKADFKKFIDENNEIKSIFHRICIETVVEFANQLENKKESLHPFVLYRFLQFINTWNSGICSAFNNKNLYAAKLKRKIGLYFDKQFFIEINNASAGEVIHKHFFDRIYLLAKYELYRQMALKLSGDMSLYDAKRLIYALLVVLWGKKFSNNLVRDRALELIFEPQRQNPNALWPTGQLLPLCHESQMSISSIQSVTDLLLCETLLPVLGNYFSELKSIYDFYVRTMQESDGNIQGWYPHDQRDKTTASWTTAFTLTFLKKYCDFLSLSVSYRVKADFHMNYRKPTIEWAELFDCTAAKSKLRLMFNENAENQTVCKTAILFGPPGTGKTTFARALSTRNGWDYLELTPGDFFSGGEEAILTRINNIFQNLLHLKNTVVFIDEIDDLIRDRESKSMGFDPRILYVNTLLPRFQELHDKGNIILIMATNHYQCVDEAIARLGRIDLIIPVGAISIHGRLKMLFKFFDKMSLNYKLLLTVTSLEVYLSKTVDMSYTRLNLCLERLPVAQIRVSSDERMVTIFNKYLNDGFSPDTVIQKFRTDIRGQVENSQSDKYSNIRPKYKGEDFSDLADIIAQERKSAVIKLFFSITNFLKNEGTENDANEIKKIVSRLCEDRLYGVITSFYDDIEDASKKCHPAYPAYKVILDDALECLRKLMNERQIL